MDTPPSLLARYLEGRPYDSRRRLKHALLQAALVISRKHSLDEPPDHPDPFLERFPWECLSFVELSGVSNALQKHGLAPATVRQVQIALRGIARTARDAGHLHEDRYQVLLESSLLPITRPTREANRPLEESEIAALFEACAADPTARGRRDAVTLAVFLSTGCHRSEAAALDLADVRWPEDTSAALRVGGQVKGNAQDQDAGRTVPLLPGADAALHAWLSVRGDDRGPLLRPVARGGHIRDARLNPQSIYQLIRALGQRAGFEKLSARELRQTCIFRMIEAGYANHEIARRVGFAHGYILKGYREVAEGREEIPPDLALPYVCEKRGARE